MSDDTFQDEFKDNLSRCPFCGDRDIYKQYPIRIFKPEDMMHQHVQCMACGKKWIDVYKFHARKHEV